MHYHARNFLVVKCVLLIINYQPWERCTSALRRWKTTWSWDSWQIKRGNWRGQDPPSFIHTVSINNMNDTVSKFVFILRRKILRGPREIQMRNLKVNKMRDHKKTIYEHCVGMPLVKRIHPHPMPGTHFVCHVFGKT